MTVRIMRLGTYVEQEVVEAPSLGSSESQQDKELENLF